MRLVLNKRRDTNNGVASPRGAHVLWPPASSQGARRLIRTRLALFLTLLLTLTAARAQSGPPDPRAVKPQGYVSDFAHVLSADDVARLDAEAQTLQNQLGIQVAMVAVSDLGGQSAFDYSYKLGHEWGVGQKGKDNGVVILLSINDHKYYTQIGYGLEPYITDADAGAWMRNLVPLLRQGQYASVYEAMLAHIQQTVAQRTGKTVPPLSAQPPPAAAPSGNTGNGIGFGPFLFFIVIVLFFLFISSRGAGGGCGPGCLLPLLWGGPGGWGGGGGGGGWGGGFGSGGGGGGGFGGFGGGDFGGGGAGGSW